MAKDTLTIAATGRRKTSVARVRVAEAPSNMMAGSADDLAPIDIDIHGMNNPQAAVLVHDRRHFQF